MENPQVNLALLQIVGQVEPLTRFDRGSLNFQPKDARVAIGKAFWRFNPYISRNYENNPGRLPYGAVGYDSSEKLDETAGQEYRRANEDLPARIQGWLKLNGSTDEVLEAADCFRGPKIFGHEYRCSNCVGEGWVKCPACVNGYNDCSACDKKGNIPCKHCKDFWGTAKGKIKCSACNGTGKQEKQRCQPCKGNGKIECPKCHGRTTVQCNPCKGRGVIDCSNCRTTNRVSCSPCNATGYFHFLRTVSCEVTKTWWVELNDEPEIVRQLNCNLENLRTLATVTQQQPSIESNTIVLRDYGIECKITAMSTEVAGQTIEIIGYGDKAKIFDFKRIVSILLDTDLVQLRKSVDNTPLRPWRDKGDLLTVTKQFLNSELNIHIDNDRYLERNIVDRTYVDQAKVYVSGALKKIFIANMGWTFLFTVSGPTILFLIGSFSGVRELIGGWVFAAAMVPGIALWIILERRIRDRVAELFGENKSKKIIGLFNKYHILWKSRTAGFILAVVLLTVVAVMVER